MNIIAISEDISFKDSVKSLLSGDITFNQVANEAEFLELNLDKGIIVIDIDTLKDQSFSLAAKISQLDDRKYLILGVTTLEVNSLKSSFNMVFDQDKSLENHVSRIIERYEQL